MSRAQGPFKKNDPSPAPAKAGAGRALWDVGSLATMVLAAAWVVAPALASSDSDAAHFTLSVPGTAVHSSAENRDGPMPGFTGGFGEKTCIFCHSMDSLNLAPGNVSISGVPERWEAGRAYPITVTLTRPRMDLGGFQLTSRFEKGGAQAGSLTLRPEDEKRLEVTTDKNVQYAHHIRPGTVLTVRDTARWTIQWTAPAAGGSVMFHVAANAASDDDSPLGDYIYATSARSAGP